MSSVLRAARLTPSGRGAVATILLEGKGAFTLFSKVFRRTNGTSITESEVFPTLQSSPVFGYFYLRPEVREEVVVHLISPNEIEIHAHGGEKISTAILDELARHGAEQISWEEWTSSPQTIEEEVWSLLPWTKTEKTARLLLEQKEGALDLARSALGLLGAPAWSDSKIGKTFFGSQDNKAPCDYRLLLQSILSERYQVGIHLTTPWSILILGAVNVGKSSLTNALLGYSRAIVDSEAGTTRDVLLSETVLGGWPVCFFDTAGIRVSHDEIEEQGIAMIRRQLDLADLILIVFDVKDNSKDPVGDCFQRLSELLSENLDEYRRKKKILSVLNKIDLPKNEWSQCCYDTNYDTHCDNRQDIPEDLQCTSPCSSPCTSPCFNESSNEADRYHDSKADYRISIHSEIGLNELKQGMIRSLLPNHFEEDWEFCHQHGLPFPIPFSERQVESLNLPMF